MCNISTDIKRLVEIYYENMELGGKEISEIFVNPSKSSIQRLKKVAREQMARENVKPWDSRKVKTACAYKAWGLDIDDLEKRLAKLNKINARSIKT